jgi:hypothetical protein
MGIEAIITVVPRSEFRRRPRKQDMPTFELDEWGDLDGVLEAIGKPVSMAVCVHGSRVTCEQREAEANFAYPTTGTDDG